MFNKANYHLQYKTITFLLEHLGKLFFQIKNICRYKANYHLQYNIRKTENREAKIRQSTFIQPVYQTFTLYDF